MLDQRQVSAEEERLRQLAQTLPDAQRKAFYQELKQQLRDPDTYAVLNWFFLAGLHYFYLGQWLRGLCNLSIFLVGIVLIVLQLPWLGILLIVGVSAWELWALFRSQIIVQDWNNKLYRELLKRYGVGS
jgi:TM2 domain-containing membrane protein YozV